MSLIFGSFAVSVLEERGKYNKPGLCQLSILYSPSQWTATFKDYCIGLHSCKNSFVFNDF